MTDTGNKAFWRNTAGIYGRTVQGASAETYEGVCARIRERLTADMYVIEAACGTGQLSYPLCGSVAQWEATDASAEMIAQAKKPPHSERLRFTVQDAQSLPYEHSTFDAAVIGNALHILPRPDLALRELRRVLKPGGLLFAPTYVHGASTHTSARVRLMMLVGFRVYHRWNADELAACVEENGFLVERRVLLPDSTAPLCYLEARSTKK